MGSKLESAKFDCYSKALPDEPMFILLARDPSAPSIVRLWATYRKAAIDNGERPESDQAMISEARQCAEHMISWRADNYGKWRKPINKPIPSESYSDAGEICARCGNDLYDHYYNGACYGICGSFVKLDQPTPTHPLSSEQRVSSDIVHRLRNYIPGEHEQFVPELNALAIAEIERLRNLSSAPVASDEAAKLNYPNLAGEARQEPVAWRTQLVNDASKRWEYRDQPPKAHSEYLFVQPLYAFPQPHHVADAMERREVFERLLMSAKLLQQNAEGCAVNHHSLDFEQQGLPGWLRDTYAAIVAADAIIAADNESTS